MVLDSDNTLLIDDNPENVGYVYDIPHMSSSSATFFYPQKAKAAL
jgi:hypothetical protein